MHDSLVLDTPEQIEAYRILAAYHGLKMEIGMISRGWTARGCPTRGRALASAQRVLAQYKVPGPTRTRKQCLPLMATLCQQLGIINNQKGRSHEPTGT